MKHWYHSKLRPCSHSHGDEVFPLCSTPSGLFAFHRWDATGLFMLSAGLTLIRVQYHAAFLVAGKETWVRAAVTLWHHYKFLTLGELSMYLWLQDSWTLTMCWHLTLDDVGQLFWRHHQWYHLVPATIVGFPLGYSKKDIVHEALFFCRVFVIISKDICQIERSVSGPVTSVSSWCPERLNERSRLWSRNITY